MPLSPMEETNAAFNSATATADQPMVEVNEKISRRASPNKELNINLNVPPNGLL